MFLLEIQIIYQRRCRFAWAGRAITRDKVVMDSPMTKRPSFIFPALNADLRLNCRVRLFPALRI